MYLFVVLLLAIMVGMPCKYFEGYCTTGAMCDENKKCQCMEGWASKDNKTCGN